VPVEKKEKRRSFPPGIGLDFQLINAGFLII
jgi:hypothetical protein